MKWSWVCASFVGIAASLFVYHQLSTASRKSSSPKQQQIGDNEPENNVDSDLICFNTAPTQLFEFQSFYLRGEAKTGTTWLQRMVVELMSQSCIAINDNLVADLPFSCSFEKRRRSAQLIWFTHDNLTRVINFIAEAKHTIPFIGIHTDHPNETPALNFKMPPWLKKCIIRGETRCFPDFRRLQWHRTRNALALSREDITAVQDLLRNSSRQMPASFAPSPSPGGDAASPFSRLGDDTDGARGGGRTGGGGGDASGPGTEGGSRSGSDCGGDARSAEATSGREQTKLINKVHFLSLMRDPRSVLVSAANFRPGVILFGKNATLDRSKVSAFVQAQANMTVSWMQFRRHWLKLLHPIFPNHEVFYSDLVRSPIAQLKAIAEFLGLCVTPHMLRIIAKRNTQLYYNLTGLHKVQRVNMLRDSTRPQDMLSGFRLEVDARTLRLLNRTMTKILEPELAARWLGHAVADRTELSWPAYVTPRVVQLFRACCPNDRWWGGWWGGEYADHDPSNASAFSNSLSAPVNTTSSPSRNLVSRWQEGRCFRYPRPPDLLEEEISCASVRQRDYINISDINVVDVTESLLSRLK